jgi:hypothetical protein
VPLAALGITVDQQALQRFLQHADESNDIFPVAAKVLAVTLLKAARQLHECKEQQGGCAWLCVLGGSTCACSGRLC